VRQIARVTVWKVQGREIFRDFSEAYATCYVRKMVPPHGTAECGEKHIKQLLTPVKFEFVARLTLKLWHKGNLDFEDFSR